MKRTKSIESSVIGDKALNWVVENLHWFNPFHQKNEADMLAQTALAELALICYIFKREKKYSSDKRIEKILNTIDEVYSQPKFHEYPFIGDKYSFIGHFFIWLCLKESSAEKYVSSSQMKWFIDQGNVLALENTPYRMIELGYALDLAGFEHNLLGGEAYYPLTFMGSDFNLVSITEPDIYSITHTIFYLTDFGKRKFDFTKKGRGSLSPELVNLFIGMAINSPNLDLAAELILVALCLNYKRNEWIEYAWEAIRRNQAENGVILTHMCTSANLNQISDEKAREQYIFTRCYHVTLITAVAGLLFEEKND